MSQRIYNFFLLTARFLSFYNGFSLWALFCRSPPFHKQFELDTSVEVNSFLWFYCAVSSSVTLWKKRIEKGYSVQKNITARQEFVV